MVSRISSASLLLALMLGIMNIGCGGGVEPGVADGPDEPEPEMTAEEEAAEEQAARDSMQ
ncbi:MAG: hypothetical protein KDA89_23180 [Planctomycetaceae bacterium]|nr:hypothetical protein [Planctomycetaceae bacterium]